MNDQPDDEDLDPAEQRDEPSSDPDANLILDYIAGKLDPEESRQIQERARTDKDFRYKLADIVLLKGLVMLALEKNPGPEDLECTKTRRMFLEYLKGRTSATKTAQLSRHLEGCFECELALERFQQEPADTTRTQHSRWRDLFGRMGTRGRYLAVTVVAVVVLAAASTVGVVRFLGSGSTPGATDPAVEPRGASRPDGLVLRRDEVQRTLDAITALDPTVDADQRLSDLVHQILDETTMPEERQDLYRQIGREFSGRIEPLLWVLAANEPSEQARAALYRVIDLKKATDRHALLAATRREVESGTREAGVLLRGLCAHLDGNVRDYIRSLYATDHPRREEWWVEAFHAIYGPMKGDPVIEERMKALLVDRSDRVRSLAVLTSADAGAPSVVPIALGLLESSDPRARWNAAVVVARYGTAEDCKKLLGYAWSQDPTLRSIIEGAMRARGIPVPQNP